MCYSMCPSGTANQKVVVDAKLMSVYQDALIWTVLITATEANGVFRFLLIPDSHEDLLGANRTVLYCVYGLMRYVMDWVMVLEL